MFMGILDRVFAVLDVWSYFKLQLDSEIRLLFAQNLCNHEKGTGIALKTPLIENPLI